MTISHVSFAMILNPGCVIELFGEVLKKCLGPTSSEFNETQVDCLFL